MALHVVVVTAEKRRCPSVCQRHRELFDPSNINYFIDHNYMAKYLHEASAFVEVIHTCYSLSKGDALRPKTDNSFADSRHM